jgi:hypothetical protein
MPTRTVVRGDSLDWDVGNVIDGSATSVAAWEAVVEFRRHPADSSPVASLSEGDGITGADTTWSVSLSEATTATFASPGRQARLYYQLRVRDATPGATRIVTLESGEIFVDRDSTRLGDGFHTSSSSESDGGQF